MRTRLVFLMAAMAIIASGCFKADFTIDVNEDGSGTVEGIVAFNPDALGDLAEAFGDDGGSTEDLCAQLDDQSGIDTGGFQDVRPYNQDGFCGTEFSSSFAPGEFESATAGLDGSGEAILRQEPNGGWYFESPFDAEDLGTGELPPGFDDIFDGAEYIFRVRLPGRQVEHNGEIDSEGFVIWDVDITNPPDRLFLRTEPGTPITGNASAGGGDDGGSALTVILIVIAVLAALGLAAWFLMRNRNDDQDPPASGVAATIPGGGPTAPPVDPSTPMTNVSGPPADGGWSPPTTADVTPPVDPTPVAPTPEPTPVAEPAPEPAPDVIASPTPEQATGAPVWDPVRRQYVQWDPNASRWLVFDDATQSWGPEA